MTKGTNSDIQAVILCGPGHGLDPLIDEDTSPKCLLPVSNKPLLYYPITWLQQNGVTNIILVGHQSLNSRLAQMIKTYISEGGNSIDIVSLEGNLFGTGTMEALRQVRPHLNSDFILLSCDLITEFPLHKMIDQHRTSDSLVTVMLAAAQAPAGKAEEANRYQDIEDNDVYAGMDESRKKLLYLEGKADIEDTIDFRMSLLNKFPCILLRTNLVDAHCYIFRKEFLEMLDSEEVFGKRKLFSVREELIPRLVKSQKVSAPSCREMALPGTNPGNTCAVRLVDGEFCVRVNNLKHYSEANRFICKSIPLGQPRVAATTEITGKAQVGNDSLAGEFTKLGDKTSVKRSIVGNNVVIGKNVKISNCIIMDKVVIEDNCKLENCIIAHCAHINEKCSLKDCDVGPNFHIPAESSLKGEVLSNHDEL